MRENNLSRFMKIAIALFSLLLSLALSAQGANADDGDSIEKNIAHGRDLAKANCSRCHSVTIDGQSPLHQAPPFWRMTIHRNVRTIEDDLFNKALPKHNVMPVFNLTREQARDIAAWIAWVQPMAHGKRILEANCAQCHAITKTDKNNHPDAIEFRKLSKFYPVDALQEAFAEGVYTEHPDMPIFKMTTLQIADVIVYLQSIQENGAAE